MAFLLVGHPSMLAGIRSLLATESNTVLMAVDEVSLLEAVQKVIPDLVIIGFSVEHSAFELRAEMAKLQKEYLIVRLR
jgi:hypothetical protein